MAKKELKKTLADIQIALFYQSQRLRNMAELDSERIARRLDRLRYTLASYRSGRGAGSNFRSSSR